MIEGQIRPRAMTEAERHEFARRAKADRLAFQAANLLDLRQTDAASQMARDAADLVGRERLTFWFRHYAVCKFDVAASVVDAFLRRESSASVI